MAVKPANLIYGVDEKPPLPITTFLGFQHICIIAISLIFPVVIIREIGGTTEQTVHLLSMSMIAGGIGVIIQALKRGPVGSGYFCPQVCGPSFLAASILAAKTGGLSLLFGMTAVSGFFEALFSRVVNRLRFLFPAEVTGLIVAMVGITVIRLAATYFLGMGGTDTAMEPRELLVSFSTLGLIIGLNIWGKGNFRLFSVLIGMTGGYIISFLAGVLTMDHINEMLDKPLVYFPLTSHPGWSFNLGLFIPFIVAMLCSSLKSIGDLTTCQKINDAEWKRPDMDNISKGILADALGCLSAGILGGLGQSTSSSNIGLSIATGATSRAIAYAMGAILFVMAFCPLLGAVFAIMPKPVMGATLIFALSFMIMAGVQIIMSRMIDARKTFVVGISMIFGLSVDIIPGAFSDLPHSIQPIFSSSLSLAAISAVILNLLFRIGIAEKASLELTPGVDFSDRIFQFMEQQGGAWGARREVIYKAMAAMNEFMEAATVFNLTKSPITMEARFDEYNLDVTIQYRGILLDVPRMKPGEEELLTDPEAQAKLAGFLMRHYVDKLHSSSAGDNHRIQMHFDH